MNWCKQEATEQSKQDKVTENSEDINNVANFKRK